MSDSERQGLALKIQEEIKILHDILQNKSCDILILDEILGCIQAGLVSVEDLLDIIDHKPDEMELVLTGRGLPEEIAERADLITEMKAVRHYMDAGVQANGIEKWVQPVDSKTKPLSDVYFPSDKGLCLCNCARDFLFNHLLILRNLSAG